jgi:hypothetical protein
MLIWDKEQPWENAGRARGASGGPVPRQRRASEQGSSDPEAAGAHGGAPGDGAICDPYLGSGTTGVACLQAGRRFIGIERDPRYFELACERLRQVAAQDSLFAHEEPSTSPTQDGLFTEVSA